MTLQEKAFELLTIRKELADIDTIYENSTAPLKIKRDALQQDILANLKNEGQFSARFDFATVTRAVRKSSIIENEAKVIEWLKKNKLAKEYTAVRLTDSFDALAKEAIKTGKEINGMIVRETEYISLSSSVKEGDKRKITTDFNVKNNEK